MKKRKHDSAGRNLANFTRCRWCGQQPVRVKRGRLASHLNPGGVKCFAIGQFAHITGGGHL